MTDIYKDIMSTANSVVAGEELIIIDKLREQVKALDNELEDIKTSIQVIISEIELEIHRYPNMANLGKKGCLRRLLNLL